MGARLDAKTDLIECFEPSRKENQTLEKRRRMDESTFNDKSTTSSVHNMEEEDIQVGKILKSYLLIMVEI